MIILVIVLLFVIGGLLWHIKNKKDHEAYLLTRKLEVSENLKRTLAMGLHARFNFPTKLNEEGEKVFEKASSIFLKQTSLEFEDFVATIFKNYFGGYVYTTPKAGDFGVDFEHHREDGIYLCQVKAWKNDLNYEAIALLHSNMVKHQAKGGYVITTSDFTVGARDYAKGLHIELVNGIDLVNYWLEAMELQIYEQKEEMA